MIVTVTDSFAPQHLIGIKLVSVIFSKCDCDCDSRISNGTQLICLLVIVTVTVIFLSDLPKGKQALVTVTIAM